MKIKYSIEKYISIFLIALLVFSSFPNVNYAEELTVIDDEINTETIQVLDESDSNDNDNEEAVAENEEITSGEKNEQSTSDEHGKQANEMKNQHNETKTKEETKTTNREVKTAPKGTSSQSSEGDDDEEELGDNETSLSSDEIKALVNSSVESAIDYYKMNPPKSSKADDTANPHSDYWVLTALWSAGFTNLKSFPWTEEHSPWSTDSYWSQGINEKNATSNEDAGAIIGSSVLGLNPYEFGNRNVVEDLIEKQNEDGSFFTAWGNPWAMIALDLVDATYDRDALIKHMLSTHHESGLFGGEWGDSDATGWALLALAPYRNDNEDVGNAIEYTINKTREHYIEENKILGQMFGANSNSTAALLMGLAANGVDLTTVDWTNEQGNIVEQFINDFQQEDGSFWWQKGSAGAVGMATEQSLLALATIKAGQSTFQLMREEISVPGQEPSNNANLSKLVIDNDIGEVPIHKEQSEYEYTVAGTVESVKITPVVDDNKATVTIDDEVVETNEPYIIELAEGRNTVEVKVTAENTETIKEYKLILIRNRVLSASQVKEFLPAPGQFVNKAPWGLNPERTLYSSGVGQGVSLGAFGGYVIFEFDEPIKNNPNNPYGVDFIVHGNAFSGNEEPGGIQVKSEEDGTWYDIAGSEHYEDETITDYTVTYTNPHDDFSESAQDVPWKDSEGETGFVNANNFHKQPYYPNPENYNTKTLHVSNEQLSYSGVKLNNRKVKFGYVDAFPEGSRNGEGTNPYTPEQKSSPIDLSWAVDSAGQPVHLDEVKYIKVYTSMLENLGSLGEISTEVTGITRVKQGERVGETEDLDKVLVNDLEIDLQEETSVYNISVDADSVMITAKGSAENIYINNEKTGSGNKSKSMTINEAEARTVRVIAQDGKDNPKIYYVNITKGEEEQIPSVDKTQLETLVDKANKTDLSNMTDDSKEKFEAALNNATTTLNNDEATQQEVDDAKLALEKAIENLRERAPPITVNVRVEAHDKTLVPTTELEVEPFDIQDYITRGSNVVPSDKVRAIHAIIRALETIDGFDPKDDEQFVLNSGGNYISRIGEYGEFTNGNMDGVMYYVNNEFAPTGVGAFDIKDGDSIVVYYVPNYMDSTYTWFDKENYEIEVGEKLSLTLIGAGMMSNSTAGAHLLINEKPYEIDGEPVLVDEDGNISITFDEAGTYHLSANRVNSDGVRNIVRPYALVEVVENVEETPIDPPVEVDEEPPVITISGMEDGQTITEDSITFTVIAEDDIDGIVVPNVTVNEKELSPKNDNEYTAKLVEGSNEFIITAVDKAGNIAEKKLTITYEPIVVNKDVQKSIDDVVNYLLTNGVTGDWEAIGLAKTGIEVPEQYETVYLSNIKSQIVNGLESGRFQITDAERLTLAALALGKDPRNVDGVNLIELIYNSPDRELWDGSIEDTMTYQGNNGLAFALIALDAANFEVPKDARWTRETLVAKLVETQREDGAWNLNDLYPAPSVDITAMVMTALAPYKNDKKVQTAIDKAVGFLALEQTDEGGFDGGSFVGGITSEATSQVIIGLTANGIDPTGEQFTQSQNLIDHLLSFQHKDGGFTHTLGDSSSNNMATEQALQALVAYDLFVRGEGALYKFDLIEHDDQDENDKEEGPETIVIEKNKLGEKIDVKANQTIVIQDSASKVELPANLPEGTSLTINIPDEDKAPKKKDKLELAGDWYDFTFVYGGNGKLPDGSVFKLTLEVDDNTLLEEAEVYHYNEQTGKWEHITTGLEKNEDDHTITVEVTHFSIYAVLAKTSDNTSETPGEPNTGTNNNQDGNKGNNNSQGEDSTLNNDDVTGGQNGNKLGSETKGTVIVGDESVENNDRDAKNKLPSTATNHYNVLLIGLLLLVIGLSVVLYRHRKCSQ